MIFYSQHVERYKQIKLGTCSTTLWDSSCFVTSFCNILKLLGVADYTPEQMNEILKAEKLYANGCDFNAPAIAEFFGLTYQKVTTNPGALCIAETNHYKNKGFPQHFFIFDGKLRVDPLDTKPIWEMNDYNLVSFRIFKRKVTPPVTPPANPPEPVNMEKFLKKMSELLGLKDMGKNLDPQDEQAIYTAIQDFKTNAKNTEIKLKKEKEDLSTALTTKTVEVETLKKKLEEAGLAMLDKPITDFTKDENNSKLTLGQLLSKLFTKK